MYRTININHMMYNGNNQPLDIIVLMLKLLSIEYWSFGSCFRMCLLPVLVTMKCDKYASIIKHRVVVVNIKAIVVFVHLIFLLMQKNSYMLFSIEASKEIKKIALSLSVSCRYIQVKCIFLKYSKNNTYMVNTDWNL